MNCRTVVHELCSYLDGELDQVTVTELEIHLGRCKDCRLIVDTTRKTIEIFCTSEPVALPEDVRSRLHEGLRRRLSRPPNTP